MIKPMPKKIMLIGAGRRIQNNFLPALWSLKDLYEVVGIHARRAEPLANVAKKWNLSAISKLERETLENVQVVAISVPTASNESVLTQLLEVSPHVEVVIDTPIAWSVDEYNKIAPLLTQFEKVTITEDYMNFPQFELLREIARSGIIGELKSITLQNIGYLYHGLALIRSFSGFRELKSAKRTVLGGNSVLVRYDLADNFSGYVIGPYRRHSTGGIVLEGTQGTISDFPIDANSSTAAKPVYILQSISGNDGISGFTLKAVDRIFDIRPPELDLMRQLPFDDKSDLNLLRGCGLITVLRSAAGIYNLNQNYSASAAFYDSFVSRRAEAGQMPLNPFSRDAAPKSKMAWSATRHTYLKRGMGSAESLPPADCISASDGVMLQASGINMVGDHLLLRNVELSGARLLGDWYIYRPHWQVANQT